MKVTGPSGPSSSQGARPAKPAGGFSVPAAGAAGAGAFPEGSAVPPVAIDAGVPAGVDAFGVQ